MVFRTIGRCSGNIEETYHGSHRNVWKVSNVKGAPQGTRDMFVYRATQDTSDEALLSWIRKQLVNIIDFVKTSHVDSKYKSFKVTFNMSDYFYLYNPELWPSGVCIVPPSKTETYKSYIKG